MEEQLYPYYGIKKTGKIVNNESSDILKFLNTEFNQLAKHPNFNWRPSNLSQRIDELNDFIYESLNNGVYKSGFARSQTAYDDAVTKVFKTLDALEEILSKNRYLCGETFTEVDIRAYVTLVRFDPVYSIHFKCSLRKLQDYPNISNYIRDLYQTPPIKAELRMDEIRNHYYRSHPVVNPSGIVAVWGGNYDGPHNRNLLKGEFPNNEQLSSSTNSSSTSST